MRRRSLSVALLTCEYCAAAQRTFTDSTLPQIYCNGTEANFVRIERYSTSASSPYEGDVCTDGNLGEWKELDSTSLADDYPVMLYLRADLRSLNWAGGCPSLKCNEGEDCIAPSVDVRARVDSEEGFDELDPATVELDLHEPGRLYIDNIELDGTASSAITITHYDRGNANEPSLQLDFSTVYIGREPTKSVEFDLSNDGATAVRVDINIGDLSGEGAQGMGGVLCSGSTGSGGGGSGCWMKLQWYDCDDADCDWSNMPYLSSQDPVLQIDAHSHVRVRAEPASIVEGITLLAGGYNAGIELSTRECREDIEDALPSSITIDVSLVARAKESLFVVDDVIYEERAPYEKAAVHQDTDSKCYPAPYASEAGGVRFYNVGDATHVWAAVQAVYYVSDGDLKERCSLTDSDADFEGCLRRVALEHACSDTDMFANQRFCDSFSHISTNPPLPFTGADSLDLSDSLWWLRMRSRQALCEANAANGCPRDQFPIDQNMPSAVECDDAEEEESVTLSDKAQPFDFISDLHWSEGECVCVEGNANGEACVICADGDGDGDTCIERGRFGDAGCTDGKGGAVMDRCRPTRSNLGFAMTRTIEVDMRFAVQDGRTIAPGLIWAVVQLNNSEHDLAIETSSEEDFTDLLAHAVVAMRVHPGETDVSRTTLDQVVARRPAADCTEAPPDDGTWSAKFTLPGSSAESTPCAPVVAGNFSVRTDAQRGALDVKLLTRDLLGNGRDTRSSCEGDQVLFEATLETLEEGEGGREGAWCTSPAFVQSFNGTVAETGRVSIQEWTCAHKLPRSAPSTMWLHIRQPTTKVAIMDSPFPLVVRASLDIDARKSHLIWRDVYTIPRADTALLTVDANTRFSSFVQPRDVFGNALASLDAVPLLRCLGGNLTDDSEPGDACGAPRGLDAFSMQITPVNCENFGNCDDAGAERKPDHVSAGFCVFNGGACDDACTRWVRAEAGLLSDDVPMPAEGACDTERLAELEYAGAMLAYEVAARILVAGNYSVRMDDAAPRENTGAPPATRDVLGPGEDFDDTDDKFVALLVRVRPAANVAGNFTTVCADGKWDFDVGEAHLTQCVQANPACAAPAQLQVPAGAARNFTLVARDIHNNTVVRGDFKDAVQAAQITAWAAPLASDGCSDDGSAIAPVCGGNDGAVRLGVEAASVQGPLVNLLAPGADSSSGSFLRVRGSYALTVCVGDAPVRGSPFALEVLAADASARNSYVVPRAIDDDGDRVIRASEDNAFAVQLRDLWDNAVPITGDDGCNGCLEVLFEIAYTYTDENGVEKEFSTTDHPLQVDPGSADDPGVCGLDDVTEDNTPVIWPCRDTMPYGAVAAVTCARVEILMGEQDEQASKGDELESNKAAVLEALGAKCVGDADEDSGSGECNATVPVACEGAADPSSVAIVYFQLRTTGTWTVNVTVNGESVGLDTEGQGSDATQQWGNAAGALWSGLALQIEGVVCDDKYQEPHDGSAGPAQGEEPGLLGQTCSCKAGSFLTGSPPTCEKCPIGEVQPQQGQDKCDPCSDRLPGEGEDWTTLSEGTSNFADCVCSAGFFEDLWHAIDVNEATGKRTACDDAAATDYDGCKAVPTLFALSQPQYASWLQPDAETQQMGCETVSDFFIDSGCRDVCAASNFEDGSRGCGRGCKQCPEGSDCSDLALQRKGVTSETMLPARRSYVYRGFSAFSPQHARPLQSGNGDGSVVEQQCEVDVSVTCAEADVLGQGGSTRPNVTEQSVSRRASRRVLAQMSPPAVPEGGARGGGAAALLDAPALLLFPRANLDVTSGTAGQEEVSRVFDCRSEGASLEENCVGAVEACKELAMSVVGNVVSNRPDAAAILGANYVESGVVSAEGIAEALNVSYSIDGAKGECVILDVRSNAADADESSADRLKEVSRAAGAEIDSYLGRCDPFGALRRGTSPTKLEALSSRSVDACYHCIAPPGSSFEWSAGEGCKTGHFGPMCALCCQGYGRSAKTCAKCEKNDIVAWLTVVSVSICVFLGAVLFVRNRAAAAIKTDEDDKRRSVMPFFKSLVNYVQISSLANEVRVRFSGGVDEMFTIMETVSNVGIWDLSSFSCKVPTSFFVRLGAFIFVPIGCVLFAAFVSYAPLAPRAAASTFRKSRHHLTVASRAVTKESAAGASAGASAGAVEAPSGEAHRPQGTISREETDAARSAFFTSVFVLWFLVYTLVLRKVIEVVKPCTQLDRSVSVLTADVNVICEVDGVQRSGYRLWHSISWAALVVYGLGIPFSLFYSIYRYRHNLESAKVRKSYGFIYLGYHKDLYYWEALIMCRKLILTGVMVYFKDDVYVQLCFSSAICGLAFLLQYMFKPFLSNQHNRFELLTLGANLVNLQACLLFVQAGRHRLSISDDIIVPAAGAVLLLFNGYIGVYFMASVSAKVYHKKQHYRLVAKIEAADSHKSIDEIEQGALLSPEVRSGRRRASGMCPDALLTLGECHYRCYSRFPTRVWWRVLTARRHACSLAAARRLLRGPCQEPRDNLRVIWLQGWARCDQAHATVAAARAFPR